MPIQNISTGSPVTLYDPLPVADPVIQIALAQESNAASGVASILAPGLGMAVDIVSWHVSSADQNFAGTLLENGIVIDRVDGTSGNTLFNYDYDHTAAENVGIDVVCTPVGSGQCNATIQYRLINI